MMTKQKENIIITTFATDGFLSAAGVLRHLKGEGVIKIKSVNSLSSYLESISFKRNLPKAIYILDIPGKKSNVLSATVKKLKELGVSISWFDHHSWDSETKNELKEFCEKLIVDFNPDYHAALMVSDCYFPNSEHRQLIQDMADGVGEEVNPIANNWFRLIGQLLLEQDKQLFEKAIIRFADDYKLTDDDKEMIYLQKVQTKKD